MLLDRVVLLPGRWFNVNFELQFLWHTKEDCKESIAYTGDDVICLFCIAHDRECLENEEQLQRRSIRIVVIITLDRKTERKGSRLIVEIVR